MATSGGEKITRLELSCDEKGETKSNKEALMEKEKNIVATHPTTASEDQAILSDADVMERLSQSSSAWKDLGDLSLDIGKFVVAERVDSTRRKLSYLKEGCGKRRRVSGHDHEEQGGDSEDDNETSSPLSTLENDKLLRVLGDADKIRKVKGMISKTPLDSFEKDSVAEVLIDMNRIKQMKQVLADLSATTNFFQNEINTMIEEYRVLDQDQNILKSIASLAKDKDAKNTKEGSNNQETSEKKDKEIRSEMAGMKVIE